MGIHGNCGFIKDTTKKFNFFDYRLRYISNSNAILIIFYFNQNEEDYISIETTKGLLQYYESYFFMGYNLFFQDYKDKITKKIRSYKLKRCYELLCS